MFRAIVFSGVRYFWDFVKDQPKFSLKDWDYLHERYFICISDPDGELEHILAENLAIPHAVKPNIGYAVLEAMKQTRCTAAEVLKVKTGDADLNTLIKDWRL